MILCTAAGYQLNKREVRTGRYYANNNRRDIPPGSPCVFCETRAEFAVAARDQVQTGTASTRRDRKRCQNMRKESPHGSLAAGIRGIARAGYKKIPRMCNGREREA